MGLFGNSRSTAATSNESGPSLPAGQDTSGRRVPSEPGYTYTEYSQRETGCLRGDGTTTPRQS